MSEEYLSPIRKLIPFFVNSRDQWKEKCKLAKQEIKRLKNNHNYMKNTNQELKEQIAVLENKISLLEIELKKNRNNNPNGNTAKRTTKL
jgi:septal ring factor EnvC (AmiA/AmiB activator)